MMPCHLQLVLAGAWPGSGALEGGEEDRGCTKRKHGTTRESIQNNVRGWCAGSAERRARRPCLGQHVTALYRAQPAGRLGGSLLSPPLLPGLHMARHISTYMADSKNRVKIIHYYHLAVRAWRGRDCSGWLYWEVRGLPTYPTELGSTVRRYPPQLFLGTWKRKLSAMIAGAIRLMAVKACRQPVGPDSLQVRTAPPARSHHLTWLQARLACEPVQTTCLAD